MQAIVHSQWSVSVLKPGYVQAPAIPIVLAVSCAPGLHVEENRISVRFR